MCPHKVRLSPISKYKNVRLHTSYRRDYCYKAPYTEEVDEKEAKVMNAGVVDITAGDGNGQEVDQLTGDEEAIDDGPSAELADEHYYCQKVPCGLCEGDCNDSTQCSGDLVCIHREANEPMDRLGCSGESMELRWGHGVVLRATSFLTVSSYNPL